MDKVIKYKRGLELMTSHFSGYKASSNLCKPIQNMLNYSTSICTFESAKFGKEQKKIKKLDYLENEYFFSGETKTYFMVF